MAFENIEVKENAPRQLLSVSNLLNICQGLLTNWKIVLSASQGLLAKESLLSASQGLLAKESLLSASQGLLARESLLSASQGLLAVICLKSSAWHWSKPYHVCSELMVWKSNVIHLNQD
jgi:hypothetical protein